MTLGTFTNRSRRVIEGWTGRRRWYNCRKCGEKFQHDGQQLPEHERLCIACWKEVKAQADKEWKQALKLEDQHELR